ncbi:MAG: sulfurtransferase TusA family protein [Caulobacter sp.]|nr:sulfurtransferase TusA family protein [Caulobacter sp.]
MSQDPLLIDARGHRCPVPTLKLRKALEGLAVGEAVTLLADDPMAKVDVPHFVSQTGHELVDSGVEGSWASFTVRKTA